MEPVSFFLGMKDPPAAGGWGTAPAEDACLRFLRQMFFDGVDKLMFLLCIAVFP